MEKGNRGIEHSNMYLEIEVVKESPLLIDKEKQVLYKVPVRNWMKNLYGSIAGGVVLMMLQRFATITIQAFDPQMRPSHSVEFNTTFIDGVRPDAKYIYCLVSNDKLDKDIAFTQSKIYDDKMRCCMVARNLRTFESDVISTSAKL